MGISEWENLQNIKVFKYLYSSLYITSLRKVVLKRTSSTWTRLKFYPSRLLFSFSSSKESAEVKFIPVTKITAVVKKLL